LWKQEPRHPPRGQPKQRTDPTFREAWAQFCAGGDAVRRLVIVGLGTMGFGMADVVLEPYGGQVLDMSVSSTTKLTALLAFGGLTGFAYAWFHLGRGGDSYRVTQLGALLGLPAFGLVIAAAPLGMPAVFVLGNFLIGFGGALFWHGTLTATMDRAPRDQAGLALGAWGAVQATAAGCAMGMSGILRDVVDAGLLGVGEVMGMASTVAAYMSVYAIEICFLLITVVATVPLIRRARAEQAAAAGADAPQDGELGPAVQRTPEQVTDPAS
jgi:BCD family chlorophyll transporter-like MFS transporter